MVPAGSLKYRNYSLKKYLDELASRSPVPGGGSAAAVAGALGAALIAMAARYSLGKGKSKAVEAQIKSIIGKSEKIRRRLLLLVELDAKAYLGLVKARKKNRQAKEKARRKARETPLEICRLCYQAIALTPFLTKKGNPHLLSDVKAAIELLFSAFNAAMINVEINH